MRLIHITTADAIEKIKEEGLKARTHFIEEDSPEIVAYYAETVRDEGKHPVRIEVDLADLLALGNESTVMAPDWGGIEEPLTYTLKRSEDEIYEEWKESDKSWRSSVDIIGTCRVEVPIPPGLLHFPGAKPRP